MDNSKINQTEINYTSGAGDAKLNIYTGRLVLEHQLSNIGNRTYELALTTVYNSFLELPTTINTHLGNKCKLNLQQYLYCNNYKYHYIDASGMKIEFEYFPTRLTVGFCVTMSDMLLPREMMKELAELSDIIDSFYDQSGLGLQLTINSNLYTITDALGNKMVFKNERLIKTISCESNQITKLYEYDNVGKLIKAYDERTPDTRFEFKYDEDNYLFDVSVTMKRCDDGIAEEKVATTRMVIKDSNGNIVRKTSTSAGMLNIGEQGTGSMAWSVDSPGTYTIEFSSI